MNDIQELDIFQAFRITAVVATFLLATDHAVQAIELCKESLALLNKIIPHMEKQSSNLFYREIYHTMFEAYRRILDNTNAIAYGSKLLAIFRDCGETFSEGELSVLLAQIYQSQHKYLEAKELYERSITIMRETGNKRGEAVAYVNLGAVFQSLGEYVKAKEYYQKSLAIATEIGDRKGEAANYGNLGTVFQSLREYVKAKEYHEKELAIAKEIGYIEGEAASYTNLGNMFHSLGEAKKSGERKGEAACYGNLGDVSLFVDVDEYVKAKENLEKALAITKEIGDRKEEAKIYGDLGAVFHSLGEHVKAKECREKELAIAREIGDRNLEAASYGNLAAVFQSLGEYVKAKEYYEKALVIATEIGNKEIAVQWYRNLGSMFQSLGEYVKAKETLEKAVRMAAEIDDRKGEAASCKNLGKVFQCLGEYVKAKEYHEKEVVIRREIKDKEGEAACYGNLGVVFHALGEYVKAKEYCQKALAVAAKIGDREIEAAFYRNLGTSCFSLGEYAKAKETLEKAIVLTMEIGDRKGEAACYQTLGAALRYLGEYVKAKEHLEKALAIRIKIGDRKEEAVCYQLLGMVLRYLGEYLKAEEYLEKALAISGETGDKEMEEACYESLGLLFLSLGEYIKAKDYSGKALAIGMGTGNKKIEATCYGNMGNVCVSLAEYRNAKQYHDKALAIFIKIGEKDGEATCYGNLGSLFEHLGDNVKAKRYYEKALEIGIEIGSKRTEAVIFKKLGTVCRLLDEYDSSEEYLKKALSVSSDIRDGELEFQCYCSLTLTNLSQKKFQEAFFYLSQCIKKSEVLRGLNADSDQIKISLADIHLQPYQLLSVLFCEDGDHKSALHVVELGRARGLADLMATQYSVKTPFSADPQSWIDIGKVIKKESNCTCLYISYRAQEVFLWILKKNGAINFRKVTVDKNTLYTRLAKVAADLDEFFSIMTDSFRSFGILPEELCEDRSLSDIEPKPNSSQEENLAALRQGKDEEDPKPSLTLFYEMLIDPVSEFVKESEIIIVPDRRLYRVPFPALIDKNGKYLSESFRIRIVPSLTTVKIVQDCPADYHSQTGVLIVGDPVVGDVIYDGRLNKNFGSLPGARKEAEMLGRLLGVQPLLGEQATKQAVLQRMRSVSLIHLAAHGNAERGEIALAPLASVTGIPQEKDYLLKMSDISQIQIRAKLVVLSCCHSARGRIRAEGVVGIARAFLGSGARSVLVSLWALEDSVTEQLMSRFYEHLVRGECASECLHEAMKWLRDNGFSDVKRWSPFMLIGDNVTFDFGNKSVAGRHTLVDGGSQRDREQGMN